VERRCVFGPGVPAGLPIVPRGTLWAAAALSRMARTLEIPAIRIRNFSQVPVVFHVKHLASRLGLC
jgi:hypothetical protein